MIINNCWWKLNAFLSLKTTSVGQLGRKLLLREMVVVVCPLQMSLWSLNHSVAVIWPSVPSMVTSLGCSLRVLPVTVPCQVPQPAQGQPCSLQGGRTRWSPVLCPGWVCVEAAQVLSSCGPAALPSQGFLWESSRTLQRSRLCTPVQTPLHHSLGLQGAGVTSGFTRNNPNLSELQLRANESCRTQADSAQSQMDAFATLIHITSSFC